MTGSRFASRYQRVIVRGHLRDRHRYVLRPLPLASAISAILVGGAPLIQPQTAQDSSTLEEVVVTAQKKTHHRRRQNRLGRRPAAAQKVAAIRALGAAVVVVDGPPINAEFEARQQAQLQGKTYVSPYNDLDVVAGQGTIGVELARQAPDLDAVFMSVGGGGLISGIATALKRLIPPPG